MKKVLVGLSGGVDSAVSAYLLREQGYDVSCGFMINYLDEENPENCPTRGDLEEAQNVARFLGLPFYTFDYREEYEKKIVDYIYSEYAAGRTPNPDVLCNNLVKFHLFLEEGRALGFDAIATGHYARISRTIVESANTEHKAIGTPQLLKGADPMKDQSYFLSRLSEFQLSHALFPIGDMLKSEVRTLAERIHLPNARRKDSQGLCFIGKVNMKEFLEKKIPKNPGNILDINGSVIGRHDGAYSYTIGQRKGIGVGGGPALFVIGKNIHDNTITVGTEDTLQLYRQECILRDWVGGKTLEEISYSAKIRYRQEDQLCIITTKNDAKQILFKEPQRAITNGQVCVIYDHDIVIGSGIIDE